MNHKVQAWASVFIGGCVQGRGGRGLRCGFRCVCVWKEYTIMDNAYSSSVNVSETLHGSLCLLHIILPYGTALNQLNAPQHHTRLADPTHKSCRLKICCAEPTALCQPPAGNHDNGAPRVIFRGMAARPKHHIQAARHFPGAGHPA